MHPRAQPRAARVRIGKLVHSHARLIRTLVSRDHHSSTVSARRAQSIVERFNGEINVKIHWPCRVLCAYMQWLQILDLNQPHHVGATAVRSE